MSGHYEFVKVDYVPKFYKKVKNQKILENFLATGMDVCELKLERMPKNCAASLRETAKRYSLPVDATQRDGEVYLIRREI
jgi:hypothetical protein